MLNHGMHKSHSEPNPISLHDHLPFFLFSSLFSLYYTFSCNLSFVQVYIAPETQFHNSANTPRKRKGKKENPFEDMSSVCISSCLNDGRDPRVPVRATYVNLYKWPESDAEFVRSRSSGAMHNGQRPAARVVDSISCRQMYLRSYRFSRKETVPEKTVKCFGRVKEKMEAHGKRRRRSSQRRRIIRRKCLVWRKVKAVLFRFFNRLLSCSASVDVVDQTNVFF
ncbi:hypothetical protein DITRI_Ditri12bG0160400 [Diplodiscus trichospermus]